MLREWPLAKNWTHKNIHQSDFLSFWTRLFLELCSCISHISTVFYWKILEISSNAPSQMIILSSCYFPEIDKIASWTDTYSLLSTEYLVKCFSIQNDIIRYTSMKIIIILTTQQLQLCSACAKYFFKNINFGLSTKKIFFSVNLSIETRVEAFLDKCCSMDVALCLSCLD